MHIAKQLDLVQSAGVPGGYEKEYGSDTVWPTAIVTDAAGIIAYAKISKNVADRPNPKELLVAILAATGA